MGIKRKLLTVECEGMKYLESCEEIDGVRKWDFFLMKAFMHEHKLCCFFRIYCTKLHFLSCKWKTSEAERQESLEFGKLTVIQAQYQLKSKLI